MEQKFLGNESVIRKRLLSCRAYDRIQCWSVWLPGIDEWLGADACLTQPDACIINVERILYPVKSEVPPRRKRKDISKLESSEIVFMQPEFLPRGKALVACPGGAMVPLWRTQIGAVLEVRASSEFFGPYDPGIEKAMPFRVPRLKHFRSLFANVRPTSMDYPDEEVGV